MPGIIAMALAIPISAIMEWYIRYYSAYAEKALSAEKNGEEISTEKKEEKNTFIRNVLILCIVNVLIAYVPFRFMKETLTIVQYRWLLLMWIFATIAIIDFKKKLISHHLLWLLLGLRVIFLGLELLSADGLETTILLSVFLGLLVAGGTMGLIYLISRGGLGFGDVKCFALMGLYLGFNDTMQAFVYCFFASTIAGLFMLISRKGKLKTEMPLAPFIFIGILCTCIFHEF